MPGYRLWHWPALTLRLQLEHRAILRYAFYLLPLSFLLTLFLSFLADWQHLAGGSADRFSRPHQLNADSSWLMLSRPAGEGIDTSPHAVFEQLTRRHADQLTRSAFAFRQSVAVHTADSLPFMMQVITADEDWFTILGWDIAEGRGLTARDQLTRQAVCVLSAGAKARWFPNTQAVGQALQIGGQWYRVEGVLGKHGMEVDGHFVADKDMVFLPRGPQARASWAQDIALLFAGNDHNLSELRKQLIVSVHTLWPDLGNWHWHSPAHERIAKRDRLLQWVWIVGVLCAVVAGPTLWALFHYFRGLESRHPAETSLRLQLGATLSELRSLRIPIAIIISGLSSAGVVLCIGWLALLDAIWSGLWWRPDLNVVRFVVLCVLTATLMTAAASLLGLGRQESDFWPDSD